MDVAWLCNCWRTGVLGENSVEAGAAVLMAHARRERRSRGRLMDTCSGLKCLILVAANYRGHETIHTGLAIEELQRGIFFSVCCGLMKGAVVGSWE